MTHICRTSYVGYVGQLKRIRLLPWTMHSSAAQDQRVVRESRLPSCVSWFCIFMNIYQNVEMGDQQGQRDWAVVQAEEGGAIINSYFPCMHNTSFLSWSTLLNYLFCKVQNLEQFPVIKFWLWPQLRFSSLMAQSWIWSMTEAGQRQHHVANKDNTWQKKHYMRNKTQNSNSFAGYFEATTWIELTAMISSLKEHCKPDLRLCELIS